MWYLFLLIPATAFGVITFWRLRQPDRTSEVESPNW